MLFADKQAQQVAARNDPVAGSASECACDDSFIARACAHTHVLPRPRRTMRRVMRPSSRTTHILVEDFVDRSMSSEVVTPRWSGMRRAGTRPAPLGHDSFVARAWRTPRAGLDVIAAAAAAGTNLGLDLHGSIPLVGVGLDAAIDRDRATATATAVAGTGLDLRLDLHVSSFVGTRRYRRVGWVSDVDPAAVAGASLDLRLDLHVDLLDVAADDNRSTTTIATGTYLRLDLHSCSSCWLLHAACEPTPRFTRCRLQHT